jgi:hypothetical protein
MFAVVSVRHFLFLYFERDGVIRTLSPNNYGDLPLHLTYVAHFVKGGRFWPENPIFTGEALHYPFGIDLFTALLVKLGVPISVVLPAMGLAGAAASRWRRSSSREAWPGSRSCGPAPGRTTRPAWPGRTSS